MFYVCAASFENGIMVFNEYVSELNTVQLTVTVSYMGAYRFLPQSRAVGQT